MIDQPSLTPYQCQYYAWILTRRAAGDTMESLAPTLVDSQVDLNPHQIEAALFACRNPLSRGVILADEVGLGKTIEAGLVISQHWAERRRRILITVPANLRKQWHPELQDKFGLQGLILEAKNYNAIRKQERRNPFQYDDGPVICSYQFYVSYTARRAIVQEFTPSSEEKELSALVADYLRRPNLKALPDGQRQLISLVLWKLLASFTHAIAGALETMANRLQGLIEPIQDVPNLAEALDEDYESLDETADEWDERPLPNPSPKTGEGPITPLSLRDDCGDAGGRATQGAVDERGRGEGEIPSALCEDLETRKQNLLREINQRNLGYFQQEVEKLDAWADDLKLGLEQEIKEIDKEVKEIRRTAATAPTLDEKLHWQKRQRELEAKRNKLRRELFDRQDEIESQRSILIEQLEQQLRQQVNEHVLFTIDWELK